MLKVSGLPPCGRLEFHPFSILPDSICSLGLAAGLSSPQVDVSIWVVPFLNFRNYKVSGDIVSKLAEEGLLTRAGKDIYNIKTAKKLDVDINVVKEEIDVPENDTMTCQNDGDGDRMYMKALYHALPMDYVTVAKLQCRLEGEANQTTVRKLMNRMAKEGYIDGKGSRKFGKRVIRSEITSRKLVEIKKDLTIDVPETENNGPSSKAVGEDPKQNPGSRNLNDGSTYGGLHSIGSELTRTRGRSDMLQNASMHSDQTSRAKTRADPRTPTSMAVPMASRESMIPGVAHEGGRINTLRNDPDAFRSSQSTQEKRARKASTVREPILQYMKRQKSQPL